MNKPQIRREIVLWLFYLLTCLLVLGLLGPRGFIWTRDSDAYYPLMNADAIKLLYPLFLNSLDMIFGQALVLDAAVVFQIIIAGACVISFSQFIRKQFSINRIEAYFCFLCTLYPFTINFPESIITHEIMTEALSYALFYPFFMYLLKAMFTGKIKYVLINCFFALLLSMTRSQLLLVWTISMFGVFYIGIKQIILKKLSRPVISGIGIVCLSLLVFVMGLKLTSIADSGLRKVLFPQNTVTEDQAGRSTVAAETIKQEKTAVESTQANDALFARVMFASDREDASLFLDKDIRGAFLAAYDAIDQRNFRYPYARDDLYKWKDIAEACNKNPGLGRGAINAYYQTVYGQQTETNSKVIYAYATIGNTLLKEHWARYLGHTLTFLPSGFISTVFIQKEQFYWLCHLITLVLYLTAIAGTIWGYRSRQCTDKKAPELMLAVLITAFAFVMITNLVFMGLQRYLIYPFGTFYIAMYVLFKDLMKKKILHMVQRKKI